MKVSSSIWIASKAVAIAQAQIREHFQEATSRPN
jgi:hypothetical protein